MESPSALDDKIRKYRAFWANDPMERPLIGFSLGGWFPLQSYTALGKFRGRRGIAECSGVNGAARLPSVPLDAGAGKAPGIMTSEGT